MQIKHIETFPDHSGMHAPIMSDQIVFCVLWFDIILISCVLIVRNKNSAHIWFDGKQLAERCGLVPNVLYFAKTRSRSESQNVDCFLGFYLTKFWKWWTSETAQCSMELDDWFQTGEGAILRTSPHPHPRAPMATNCSLILILYTAITYGYFRDMVGHCL